MKLTNELLSQALQTVLPASFSEIRHISLDSRQVENGGLFIAIKGEHFDGNDFVNQALERGAALVIAEISHPDARVVTVQDSVTALGLIAREYRKSLRAKVIAITGSSGKTSTKDLTAHVLRQYGEVVSPVGSFNNEIGMPLTLLQATKDTDFVVLEMGMRGHGHISYLTEIAQPDVAALINVGSAHIELLGSREAIAQAKGEIFDSLPHDGIAIAFADDSLVMGQLHRTSARSITFGESPSAHVRIAEMDVDLSGMPVFDLFVDANVFRRVSVPLIGEHNAINAAAAVACAHALGLDLEPAVTSLRDFHSPSKWRMEKHELPRGITVINDAYNANPESMRAGLKALKIMAKGRKTWAILGEMRELGSHSMVAHDEIGRLCVRLDISQLVAIGTAGKIMHMGAEQEGSWDQESRHCDTWQEAAHFVIERVQPGDIVYIKASRGVGLERVAETLITELSRENLLP